MSKTKAGITNLVIGQGQIGTAVQAVLRCPGVDKGDPVPKAKAIHVCFGYFDGFVETVKEYEEQAGALLVIVHSTVPVGTCDPHGWVHSPCRGIHPHLEAGIRTFVKFFGGEQAKAAASFFEEKGVSCETTPFAATTEFLKLYDTEQYRDAIVREKQMYEDAQKLGIDFDVAYTRANQTYNEGYEKLGHPEYKKYVLKHMEGPIGGHCVEPNHKLIYGS